jgi:4-diphosphocytidyl-2-C-methyl-D-erythritol kinase
VITFPKAKINLGLRITGKRADGFHDIETVFYPAGLCDALEFVEPEEALSGDILTITGCQTGTRTEDNMVIKALRRFREFYHIPFLKIHLHKAIPAGAGLGGGSSDASFFIKTLVRFYNISASDDHLKNIVLELGSDCPFFIDLRPSFAEGRGEKLRPVGEVLSGYYILLVNPGISISTKEAYANCHPAQPVCSLDRLINLPVREWPGKIINDFEEYVFSLHPVIGSLKKTLYDSGALFSSMSGSGSTVFGIYTSPPVVPGEIRDFVIYSGMIE